MSPYTLPSGFPSQEYDSKGRIIRKKKKYHDGESGSEYEYDYDEHGNVIKRKIKSGNASKKRVVRSKLMYKASISMSPQ